jgi:hypothetical protein
LIAFYEKQGIRIFPGAKRPLIGNLIEHLAYKSIRTSEEVVEIKFKWLMDNISRFAGAYDKKSKDELSKWSPITLMYLPGLM